MTISSLDAAVQNYASQLFSSQQAQSVTDPFLPEPLAGSGNTGASAGAAGSNSLAGTGAASLDSQTLGALLGLAQQDATEPSQQSGQAAQAQGAHHRHHHHGGGPSQASSASSTATTASASTPDPTAAATTQADDVDASLEAALLSA